MHELDMPKKEWTFKLKSRVFSVNFTDNLYGNTHSPCKYLERFEVDLDNLLFMSLNHELCTIFYTIKLILFLNTNATILASNKRMQ